MECSEEIKMLDVKSPKSEQPSKTLLDEFAMAAELGLISGHYDRGPQGIAIQSFECAAAMMAERGRRDEMGNVKEVE